MNSGGHTCLRARTPTRELTHCCLHSAECSIFSLYGVGIRMTSTLMIPGSYSNCFPEVLPQPGSFSHTRGTEQCSSQRCKDSPLLIPGMLSVFALSFPVSFPAKSSPWPSSPGSTRTSEGSRDLTLSPPFAHNRRTSRQAVSWGVPRAHLACFPSCRSHVCTVSYSVSEHSVFMHFI